MRSLIGSLMNQAPIKFATGVGRGLGGMSNSTATNAENLMRQYGSVSTLFAIVDRLATGTAAPVWHLMQKGTETEITSHPCIDLWNNPNDFYTQNDFIEAVQQHMDLVGEQWWVVAHASGFPASPPLELWPVRPDRMTPIPDPDLFISGYVYNNGTEKVPLENTDVIWTKKQNPLDPYRGMGPVQTLLSDLDADKYASAWNSNFFRNSALPGGIITVDGHLDDAQFEEMVLRWREQHQGVSNAHRVAILEKATFQEMRYTQRDMQFDKLRTMNQEIIALAFGFPLHMLGVSHDINRANAEAQEIMFQRWLIVPRLERIKQLLNTKLLPMYGSSAKGMEWVYESPVPEDKKGDGEVLTGQAQAVSALITAGFDPEESAAAAHLPPIKFIGAPTPPTPVQVAPAKSDPVKARAKAALQAFLESRIDG